MSNHDVYTLGQFKDDQFQAYTAQIRANADQSDYRYKGIKTLSDTYKQPAGWDGLDFAICWPRSAGGTYPTGYLMQGSLEVPDSAIWTKNDANNYVNGVRHGKVTRGKRIGINYIIKY